MLSASIDAHPRGDHNDSFDDHLWASAALMTGVVDDVDERVAAHELDLSRPDGVRQAWLYRMLYTRRPLQEKMVLFWHGHLTSAASKIGGGGGGGAESKQPTL